FHRHDLPKSERLMHRIRPHDIEERARQRPGGHLEIMGGRGNGGARRIELIVRPCGLLVRDELAAECFGGALIFDVADQADSFQGSCGAPAWLAPATSNAANPAI